MVNSLVSKIIALKDITASGATTLYSSLDGCILSGTSKQILMTALDKKMSGDPIMAHNMMCVKPQLLKHPTNYLTQGDWNIIEDPATSQKVAVLLLDLGHWE